MLLANITRAYRSALKLILTKRETKQTNAARLQNHYNNYIYLSKTPIAFSTIVNNLKLADFSKEFLFLSLLSLIIEYLFFDTKVFFLKTLA